jgi:hypothetical protein
MQLLESNRLFCTLLGFGGALALAACPPGGPGPGDDDDASADDDDDATTPPGDDDDATTPPDDDDSAGDDDDDTTVDPFEAITAALADLNDVLALTAFSGDLNQDLDHEPEDVIGRGGEGDPCPIRTFTTLSVSIDYGGGCVPDTGWTDDEISGAMTITVERVSHAITVAFDSLTINGLALEGSIAGSYDRVDGELQVDAAVVLEVTTSPGSVEFDASLTIAFPGEGGVLVDGAVTFTDTEDNESSITLAGLWFVELSGASCPLPSDGTATIVVPDMMAPIVVTFDADSPSDGTASVAVGPVEEDVDVCALAGSLDE